MSIDSNNEAYTDSDPDLPHLHHDIDEDPLDNANNRPNVQVGNIQNDDMDKDDSVLMVPQWRHMLIYQKQHISIAFLTSEI